jgi:hypothetical protein
VSRLVSKAFGDLGGGEVGLIEVGGCVFDSAQLARSRGYESLDPIGREAFVNHVHLTGTGRTDAADRMIAGWVAEMEARWPGRGFRIYRAAQPAEVTIRFHVIRPGSANWCELGAEGVEVITVGPGEVPAEPGVADVTTNGKPRLGDDGR